MGVDFIACDLCGETFPDCGDWKTCENDHALGPCCMIDDQRNLDEDDQLLTRVCPVCIKGGSVEQRLEAALVEVERMKQILAASEKRAGEYRKALEETLTYLERGSVAVLRKTIEKALADQQHGGGSDA